MSSPHTARPHPLVHGRCCYSDEDIAAIDAKSDDSLDWRDFSVIFCISQCSLPPEQRAYFRPLAYEYVRAHPNEGYELLPGLMYEVETLQAEERAWVHDAVRAIWRAWTSTFVVAAVDVGIELLETLVEYARARELAGELVASLTRAGRSDAEAEWFVALARALPEKRSPALKVETIDTLVNDVDAVVAAHAQLGREF